MRQQARVQGVGMTCDDPLKVLPAAACDAVAFGVPLLEAIPQPRARSEGERSDPYGRFTCVSVPQPWCFRRLRAHRGSNTRGAEQLIITQLRLLVAESRRVLPPVAPVSIEASASDRIP